jgi:hypothetical protein
LVWSGLGYTNCCRLPLAATLGLVAMVGMYDLSSKEREWVQNTYSAYGTTVGGTGTRAGGFWRAIPVPRSVIFLYLVFRRVDCTNVDPPVVLSAYCPIKRWVACQCKSASSPVWPLTFGWEKETRNDKAHHSHTIPQYTVRPHGSRRCSPFGPSIGRGNGATTW